MQPCNRLTAKEIQVATLVWEGQTNREIGKMIGTTEQVIKNYLRNTFDKLGVWSRLELALYVAAHGGLHWRDPVVSAASTDHVDRGGTFNTTNRAAPTGSHQQE